MRKLLISILAVALGAALIYGATMAWFTDEATVADTTFTAGTVEITGTGGFDMQDARISNVNPGDDFTGTWTFSNAGSKRIKLRVIPTFEFAPSLDHQDEFIDATLLEQYGFIASDKFKFSHTAGAWVDLDDTDGWRVENETTTIANSIGLVLYYDGYPVAEGSDIILADGEVTFDWTLSFHGAQMDNKYQGSTLTVGGVVQAIQASHQYDETSEPEGWTWAGFATYNTTVTP